MAEQTHQATQVAGGGTGGRMKITAKQTARKWTKDRLKRHPGEWAVEQEEQSVPCWPGERAIMLKNISDGWSGWFPLKDVVVDRVPGEDK